MPRSSSPACAVFCTSDEVALGLSHETKSQCPHPVAAAGRRSDRGDSRSVLGSAQRREGLSRIHEADLRADLAFIASDALDGRMSLERGDDASAEWVADEFAKSGLTPAATDHKGNASFLQPVPLIEYRPDREANYLALERGGVLTRWRAPEILGGFRDDTEITAPLVFAGFGITAPNLAYDDYRDLDARGRIVLVFEHEPQETDPRRASMARAIPAMRPTGSRRSMPRRMGRWRCSSLPSPTARSIELRALAAHRRQCDAGRAVAGPGARRR